MCFVKLLLDDGKTVKVEIMRLFVFDSGALSKCRDVAASGDNPEDLPVGGMGRHWSSGAAALPQKKVAWGAGWEPGLHFGNTLLLNTESLRKGYNYH